MGFRVFSLGELQPSQPELSDLVLSFLLKGDNNYGEVLEVYDVDGLPVIGNGHHSSFLVLCHGYTERPGILHTRKDSGCVGIYDSVCEELLGWVNACRDRGINSLYDMGFVRDFRERNS